MTEEATPLVLALHGAYSAREEILGFLEPMLPGARILAPDLPGHGSHRDVRVGSAAGALDWLEEQVLAPLAGAPVAVVGHSYGAHLARGLAARRPTQVRGLALICPLVPGDQHMEPHRVVVDDGAAAALPAGLADHFRSYFVVQDAATVRRFLSAVAPALDRDDADVVWAQLEHDALDTTTAAGGLDGPVLVMTARDDAFVGYRQHAALLASYRRATSVVVADAGHALPHEHPDLVGAALRHWLAQVSPAATGSGS